MQLYRSQLPTGKYRAAWEAVRNHLRAPGTELMGYVRTWQLGEGGRDDDIEPPNWTAEMFPILRLEIDGQGGAWRNEVTSRTPLALSVSLGLQGTDHRLLWDFWEAVHRRMYPGDQSLYTVVKPLGVVAYNLVSPAVSREKYADGSAQVAKGQILLNFEIRSQY